LLHPPIDWQFMDYLMSFQLYLIDQFDFNTILHFNWQKGARGEKIYDARMIVALF
jgi:hypothetical protein